ncbi:MAG: MerR family transcriptional regulator [Ignavibacteriae bacterium]|nr:MerR family transcriptional regulator [Ignavibacteriota bacterium]NOG96558.1 MerR family transcriptional regulator [Ignavibacteriota bacterium]
MKDFGLKKLYYSISEVSKLTNLEQYILRYWETEFDELRPSKNRAGNRIYTNKDIKLILQIKKLLRDEKYTIEGARKILDQSKSSKTPQPAVKETQTKKSVQAQKPAEPQNLKKDLEDLRAFLVDLQSNL